MTEPWDLILRFKMILSEHLVTLQAHLPVCQGRPPDWCICIKPGAISGHLLRSKCSVGPHWLEGVHKPSSQDCKRAYFWSPGDFPVLPSVLRSEGHLWGSPWSSQERVWKRAQLIPITTKSDLEKLLDLLINSVATLFILAKHNFPSLRRATSYRVTDIQWEPDLSGGLTLAQSRDWVSDILCLGFSQCWEGFSLRHAINCPCWFAYMAGVVKIEGKQ